MKERGVLHPRLAAALAEMGHGAPGGSTRMPNSFSISNIRPGRGHEPGAPDDQPAVTADDEGGTVVVLVAPAPEAPCGGHRGSKPFRQEAHGQF